MKVFVKARGWNILPPYRSYEDRGTYIQQLLSKDRHQPVLWLFVIESLLSFFIRIYLSGRVDSSARRRYEFSTITIVSSTITPIARIIPVSDMIFDEILSALRSIKETAIEIGICIRIMRALLQ
jgi:hypothetical protein